MVDIDATSAFITALLPMLKRKIQTFANQVSKQPQMLSHLIHEVMVEQLEFLTKAEIRERNATGGWGEAAQAAPEPTPAAASGHH